VKADADNLNADAPRQPVWQTSAVKETANFTTPKRTHSLNLPRHKTRRKLWIFADTTIATALVQSQYSVVFSLQGREVLRFDLGGSVAETNELWFQFTCRPTPANNFDTYGLASGALRLNGSDVSTDWIMAMPLDLDIEADKVEFFHNRLSLDTANVYYTGLAVLSQDPA
jgi:hypothetical protein